jgi:hypothetical protein
MIGIGMPISHSKMPFPMTAFSSGPKGPVPEQNEAD